MLSTGCLLTSATLSCWSEAGRGVVKYITVALLRLSSVLCYQIQNGHTWEKIKKSTSRNPLKSFFMTLWPKPENEHYHQQTHECYSCSHETSETVSNNSHQTSNVLSQSLKGGWQLSMQGRQMSISRCWISSQDSQILIQYIVCKIFPIVCKLCDLCRHNFLFYYRAVQDLLHKY